MVPRRQVEFVPETRNLVSSVQVRVTGSSSFLFFVQELDDDPRGAVGVLRLCADRGSPYEVERRDDLGPELPRPRRSDRPILDVAVVAVLAGDEAVAEPAAHPLVEGGERVAVPVLRAADGSVRRLEGVPARPEERRQLLDERAVLCPARRDPLLRATGRSGR